MDKPYNNACQCSFMSNNKTQLNRPRVEYWREANRDLFIYLFIFGPKKNFIMRKKGRIKYKRSSLQEQYLTKDKNINKSIPISQHIWERSTSKEWS